MLSKRKTVVNLKNSGNKCFLYSLLALQDKTRDNTCIQIDYLGLVDRMNLDGITFPIPIVQVSKF